MFEAWYERSTFFPFLPFSYQSETDPAFLVAKAIVDARLSVTLPFRPETSGITDDWFYVKLKKFSKSESVIRLLFSVYVNDGVNVLQNTVDWTSVSGFTDMPNSDLIIPDLSAFDNIPDSDNLGMELNPGCVSWRLSNPVLYVTSQYLYSTSYLREQAGLKPLEKVEKLIFKNGVNTAVYARDDGSGVDIVASPGSGLGKYSSNPWLDNVDIPEFKPGLTAVNGLTGDITIKVSGSLSLRQTIADGHLDLYIGVKKGV